MPSLQTFYHAITMALQDERTYCATLSSADKEVYLSSMTEIELLHRIVEHVQWTTRAEKFQSLMATKGTDFTCNHVGQRIQVEAKWFCTNTTRQHLRGKGLEDWTWLTAVPPNDTAALVSLFPTSVHHLIGVQKVGCGSPVGSWAFSECLTGDIDDHGVPNVDLFMPYWAIACQNAANLQKLCFRNTMIQHGELVVNGRTYFVDVIGDPKHDPIWALVIANQDPGLAVPRTAVTAPAANS
jgi:hypothetical protein